MRIGDHHALDRVVHHGGRQPLALLRLALGREVGQDAREALGPPVGAHVAHAPRMEPAVGAVEALQARRFLERAIRTERPQDRLAHAHRVLGVQALQQVDAGAQPLAVVAQHAHHPLRIRGLGLRHVPVPHAAAAAVQRQAQARLAALQRRAGGLGLADVLQHAHQLLGFAVRGGHVAHGAQHGHGGAAVRRAAQALVLVVVDLAAAQSLQLGHGPAHVGGRHQRGEHMPARLLPRHAQPAAQALVGPEHAPVQGHACDAGGRIAPDAPHVALQRPAPAVGAVHAPQQPPGQQAGEQHVGPAFPGLVAREAARVVGEGGEQRVAHEHPGHAQGQVEDHAPAGRDPRCLACACFLHQYLTPGCDNRGI